MKRFLRRYVLPPAVYDALRSLRRASSNEPYLWRGAPLSDVQFDHAFGNDSGADTRFVTRGDEGRVALICRTGAEFGIGPFDGDAAYIQYAVAPLDAEHFVQDVTIEQDGRTVASLKGRLPDDRWVDIRVPAGSAAEGYRIAVEFGGPGRLCFANPMTGTPRGARARRNVIVLVLDSLQPRQVGCDQGTRPNESLTPHIDRFFADGIRFGNAYAQGEWTLPSVSSMMTGLYAIQHGNYNPHEASRRIPPRIPTVAELLRKAGYKTLCYSTGRRFVPTYGHYRGFDRFFYSDWHKPFIGSHITTSAIEFMASHRDEPFFCFLHYYDPHPPFGTLSYLSDVKASPMRWEFPGMLYNYWKKNQERVDLVGDLAHLSDVKTSQLDLWLNSLFAYLETSGLIENTTVFLTSDHGREYYKGVPLLTQDRVAVPLLVRDPDRHAEVAEEFVEPGVDLYPTILKLAGLETPEHAVGHDLLASKRHRREFALSESLFNGVYEIVLRNDSWCYAFKCRMDPRSGEIHTDDQIAEFLYERADDLQNRYDGTDRRADHQDAGAAFRAEVEAFCHETERYFDDSSLLDRSS